MLHLFNTSIDCHCFKTLLFLQPLFSWDLQRIREQRQYEKLRARYEGEDRSQDRMRSQAIPSRSPASVDQPGGGSGVVTSLWASTEDVAHIQIEPWLPVSVFGGPLPNIPRS